jgi:hypothetical protein
MLKLAHPRRAPTAERSWMSSRPRRATSIARCFERLVKQYPPRSSKSLVPCSSGDHDATGPSASAGFFLPWNGGGGGVDLQTKGPGESRGRVSSPMSGDVGRGWNFKGCQRGASTSVASIRQRPRGSTKTPLAARSSPSGARRLPAVQLEAALQEGESINPISSSAICSTSAALIRPSITLSCGHVE